MPAVISFRDVTFSYTTTPVVRDVTLELAAGELVCLVGPNGGGKSTLLRLILGLLKPQQGSVTVLGTTPEAARPRLGYVPQYSHFDPKFPVNVMDVVLMGRLARRWAGPYGSADRAAARDALAEVQLADLATRHFAALSGGQRQRVLIARALASQPEILLLDEPTSNVDALAEQKLYDLLTHLNRHLTIVLVSHDLGVVSQMVSSVVCVHQQVHQHPTSELTGDLVRAMYGADVTLIRHDHCHAAGHHHCHTGTPDRDQEAPRG
jgi:zinc transport system ATP-binding protein